MSPRACYIRSVNMFNFAAIALSLLGALRVR